MYPMSYKILVLFIKRKFWNTNFNQSIYEAYWLKDNFSDPNTDVQKWQQIR